jgi:hypothetical protein
MNIKKCANKMCWKGVFQRKEYMTEYHWNSTKCCSKKCGTAMHKNYRYCDHCYTVYHAKVKGSKYCCKDCSGLAQIQKRKNQRNADCINCGKNFSWIGNKKRIVCTTSCDIDYKYKNNPLRKTRKCKNCNIEYCLWKKYKPKSVFWNYCCLKCKQDDDIKKHFKNKTCSVCAEPILSHRSKDTKTCDDDCHIISKSKDFKEKGVCGKSLKKKFKQGSYSYWFKQISPSRITNTELTRDYLTELMISQNFTCPVFGFKFHEIKGRSNHSATLDRIDNTKSYVVGNVMWVSWRANRLKSDMSINELKQFIHFYKGLLEIDLKYPSMLGFTFSNKHLITGVTLREAKMVQRLSDTDNKI